MIFDIAYFKLHNNDYTPYIRSFLGDIVEPYKASVIVSEYAAQYYKESDKIISLTYVLNLPLLPRTYACIALKS